MWIMIIHLDGTAPPHFWNSRTPQICPQLLNQFAVTLETGKCKHCGEACFQCRCLLPCPACIWLQYLKSLSPHQNSPNWYTDRTAFPIKIFGTLTSIRGAADVGMQPTISTVSTTSSTTDMPDTKDFRIPTSVIAPQPLVSSSTCSPPGTTSSSSTMRPPPPPPPPKSRSNGGASGSDVKLERNHHEEPSSSIPDLGKSSLRLSSRALHTCSYYCELFPCPFTLSLI